jgi:hypothetical protein
MADLGARTPGRPCGLPGVPRSTVFARDRQIVTDNIWHMPELYAVRSASRWGAKCATAYEFIQYQRSLAEAKSAEVTALGVYAKAKAALQRAVGSTLVDNNVIVDDAYVNRMYRIGMSPAQKSKPQASR